MAKVQFSDKDLTLEVPEGTSFTTICDDYPTGILLGCRDAACGVCLIEVLEGVQDLSPITEGEEILIEALAEGIPGARLACQCKIEGAGPISVKGLPT
ncbi:MAG: 2Fe-2S iron-sulfur cluster-binding protein [Cyanobacteria bacterium P01_F01_bin.86]